ncbi:MAG: aldehyde dehydrogenase family protein [Candidatus Bathyarchaeia archaeon]
MIIASDADLEAAVQGVVDHTFHNIGRGCNSLNRIYVESSVHENFVQLFVERAQALNIGSGRKDLDLGHVIANEAIMCVTFHIDDAVAKRIKVTYGETFYSSLRMVSFLNLQSFLDVHHGGS